MKNNKIIMSMIISLVLLGAAIKANTKLRVSQLEKEVVELSKSERNAWKKIEEMNTKVSGLEQEISLQTYQARKQALEAAERQHDIDDYDDDDDDFDDDEYNDYE